MTLTMKQRIIAKAKKKEYMRIYMQEYAKRRKEKKANATPITKAAPSVKFNGDEKKKVRETVLSYAKKTGDLLDFYGTSGEMYHEAKKLKNLNVLSIDDGRSFGNAKELKKIFKKNPDTKLTSLKSLIENATEEDQKGTIWADYCGPLSSKTREDLKNIHPIMKNKGYFFITLLRGRETLMGAGTDRDVINAVTQKFIKKDLKEAGINVKRIFHHEYKSIPEYEGRSKFGVTPIGVDGYKYTKDVAYIKRMQKKNQKKAESMLSKKQIKNMMKQLAKCGYTITQNHA